MGPKGSGLRPWRPLLLDRLGRKMEDSNLVRFDPKMVEPNLFRYFPLLPDFLQLKNEISLDPLRNNVYAQFTSFKIIYL